MSEHIEKAERINALSLRTAVEQTVKNHFLSLSDKKIVDLYALVLEEIEIPLYKVVMEHCRYNQSRAAIVADARTLTIIPTNVTFFVRTICVDTDARLRP